MAIVERRIKDCRQTSPLLRYAANHTSQGGEDGIIAEIFKRIGSENLLSPPFCVDIGSWVGPPPSSPPPP
jgi:hypothetical protein